MKNTLCLLICLFMCALFFAGCETDEQSMQDTNESGENVSVNSESIFDESDISAEDEVTLTEIVVTGQALDTAVDTFYEDDYYEYYFPTMPQHEYVIVKYSDGTSQNVKDALADGRITVFDLNKFDIEYEKIAKEYSLLRGNELVVKIHISSLPEAYEYSYDGEDAEEIVKYLKGLALISDFSENPDEYAGMTWVIELEYENGANATVYHFGNMFIRTDHGKWYMMEHSEALKLSELIKELNK
ncbi:MAG: hypothetical protein II987_07535 [Clostridia bacterium]|nr:hypothetical protein [Clostridia bacterium]